MANTAKTAQETEGQAAAPAGSRSQRQPLGRFAMIGLLVVLSIAFSLILPRTFATTANWSTIFSENAILAMLALAVMVPLIVNEFDLSLASVMGLAAMFAAGLPGRDGVPVPLTVLIILALGIGIGVAHSILVVRFGLPSLVVTLGTNSVLLGMILLYSGGAVLYEAIAPEFLFIGSTKVLGGVGLPVFLMAILAVVMWFFLEKRPAGRRFYAIGANETAARLAGINTAKYRTIALITAPTIAALAGIILVGRVGSASPTSFSAYFLPAFAAAFLSIAGYRLGHYNTLGVITAVYLIAVGVSGLSLLGVPSWMEPVFDGGALIIAIALAHAFTRTRAKRRASG